MPALTSIVDTSYKLPRAFLQVSFGVGPRSPGSAAMRILLTGNKTSSGTAANAELKAIFGADDAKTYFGAGSELHLMAKALFKAFPTATAYAIAIATAGTAATGTITFTGGPASAAGTVSVWVLGEKITVDVASGDSITTIAAAVSAAINQKTDWPVTASPAVGVVTVTAKNTGPRGNRISLRTQLSGATGVSHTPLTGFLSSGATYDSPQTALDAVVSERYHFIVAPYFTATELTIYKSHVGTQAQPIQGRRQHVVWSSPDTLATAITLADTLNSVRMRGAWYEDGDDTPAMIAAAYAGFMASRLSADRATNLDYEVIPGLKDQYALDDVPTEGEMNSALNNGLTPLYGKGGEVKIVRAITTYHLDTAGNDDFSVMDIHYADAPDFLADKLEGNHYSQWKGFKLAPDTAEGAPPDTKVATPKSIRGWIAGQVKEEENKLFVNVDALAEQIVVEIDPTARGRVNAFIPLDCVELYHQFAAEVAQTG